MGEFGGFRLEEFTPRRRVVVQIAHLDYGARHERGRFRLGTAFAAQFPGLGRTARPAGQAEAGHRGHRGQRLTAKTKAADLFQIIEGGDFGGGVPGQRQNQLIFFDAAAVVDDADQLDAAFLQVHLDGTAASVQAVFQELLEYRSRSFDDFTGSNLADQQIGQTGNPGQRCWQR